MVKGLIEFIETSVFTRRLNKLADDTVLKALQEDLIQNPTRGAVIRGTNGVRKSRVARPGKGKSGGFRYLYLYFERHGKIYLFFIFDKTEQDNLTAQQTRNVRQLVEDVRKELDKKK